MSNLTLTYFNDVGRAEAIRLAFLIGKIQFQDKRLEYPEFLKLKQEGTYKFGQLPILEVNGKKLLKYYKNYQTNYFKTGEQYAQSLSLLRYAGKLSNLYPQIYLEQLVVDEGVDLLNELMDKIGEAFYMIFDEKKKEEAIEQLKKTHIPHIFGCYEKKIQKSSSGYYSQKLSIADIYFYAIAQWVSDGSLHGFKYDLDQHKSLQKLIENIALIPEIQALRQQKN